MSCSSNDSYIEELSEISEISEMQTDASGSEADSGADSGADEPDSPGLPDSPIPEEPISLPVQRFMTLMEQHESGEIIFSDVATNDEGIEFRSMHWYTNKATDSHPRNYSMGVHINDWSSFYGLVNHPGLQIVHVNDCPSLRIGLESLFIRLKTIGRCSGCARIIPNMMMVDKLCSSCNMREALCDKSKGCSICQEETVHYTTTDCDHHFHPMCLISAKKAWLKDHGEQHDDGLLFPCPNCRRGVSEKRPYS